MHVKAEICKLQTTELIKHTLTFCIRYFTSKLTFGLNIYLSESQEYLLPQLLSSRWDVSTANLGTDTF